MKTKRILLSVTLSTLFLFSLSLVIAQQVASDTAPVPALGPRIEAVEKPVVEVPPPESVQTDITEIEFDAIVRVEVDTKQPNYRVP